VRHALVLDSEHENRLLKNPCGEASVSDSIAYFSGQPWVKMRGTDYQHDKLFSYVRPDSRVPADHPLRTIRRVTDTALIVRNSLASETRLAHKLRWSARRNLSEDNSQ
jgi:hypothetical protein